MRKIWFLVFFSLVGCQTGPRVSEAGPNGARLSILQGVTTSNWTQITLHRKRDQNLEVSFTTSEGLALPPTMIRRNQKDFQASDWVVDGFVIHDIDPKIRYRMIVKHEGKIVDQRSFSALDRKDSLKFAVVSCLNDRFKDEQRQIWQDLISKRPDLIMMIGDNVYADLDQGTRAVETSPTQLWRRYGETRELIALYQAENLIPVLATWDDHDFGMNDGDRRYKYKNEAQAIFYSFFQQDIQDSQFSRGPGVSSVFRFGEQTFVFLDSRSFRSPNHPSPVCQTKIGHKFCQPNPKGPPDLFAKQGETHFGKEQEKWLWQQLKAVSGPVYLISGDQWFGAYHPFESYEGNHPQSFKKFMTELAKTKARVVFVAGDRHNFEMSRVEKELLGYETFELISSPIHGTVYPNNWIEFPNGRQIVGVPNVFNYSLVESAVVADELKFKVQAFKLGGDKIFDRDFSLSLKQ